MAVVVATNLGWLMKSRGAHAGARKLPRRFHALISWLPLS
jgi:hypothetical protein